MNPLVSVIIPTYNRIGPLCELVEALFQQSYSHIEIIIVNDAGTPVDIVRELYPELTIKIVNLKENKRHVAARNAGLKMADGQFIMLCDDDDILLPSHIETMVKAIDGYDFVYSDVEIVEFASEEGARKPVSRLLFAYEYDKMEMRKFSTFVPSGCLFNRELLTELGPFDEEVYHYWDWDFILRVSDRHKINRVPIAGVLYAFSSAGDNLSGAHSSMQPFLEKLSAKHSLGELPTKNFFTLLEEPGLKAREAASEVVWDGNPFLSRLKLMEDGVN